MADRADHYPPGKLPVEVLDRLLDRLDRSDPRVLVGPRVGEDATVIDFGDSCLVAKTDPITFATEEIGHYAVHVNANDIATMGAVPRWFLPTLLLPDGSTDATLVERIFDSIHRATSEIGVTVCGGHTEITVGLDRPIVVGQMLGEVPREDLVESRNLREGDRLLLTKGLGIEAAAIIAHEKEQELITAGIERSIVDRAKNYIREPGIGVSKEARIACDTGDIHAMHDPTEGGIATALRELSIASGSGIRVDLRSLKVPEESRVLCEVFDLDPLGVISSGALLIGLAPEDAEKVSGAINDSGIRCDAIGEVMPAASGLRLVTHDGEIELPEFDRDEIAKIF